MSNVTDTKQVTLRISPELWERFNAACKAQDITQSQVIRRAVTEFVNAHEAKERKNAK